jgi:hypothetical protein
MSITTPTILNKNPGAMVVATGARHFQLAQSNDQIINFRMAKQA